VNVRCLNVLQTTRALLDQLENQFVSASGSCSNILYDSNVGGSEPRLEHTHETGGVMGSALQLMLWFRIVSASGTCFNILYDSRWVV
jgi:hypothetical protein